MTTRELMALALLVAAIVYPFLAMEVPNFPAAARDGITHEQMVAVAGWVVPVCLVLAMIAVPPWRYWQLVKLHPYEVIVAIGLGGFAIFTVKYLV